MNNENNLKQIANTTVFIDTETGGVEDHYSCLSLALIKVSEDFSKVEDKIEIFIKHQEYIISYESCKVNHFNIIDHIENSIQFPEYQSLVKPDAAVSIISDFIKRNFPGVKPSLSGWNGNFDYRALKNLFLLQDHFYFKDVFDFKVLDVCSVTMGCFAAGVLRTERIPRSLSEAAEEFGVKIKQTERLHTPLYDTEIAIKVFKKLITLIGAQNG